MLKAKHHLTFEGSKNIPNKNLESITRFCVNVKVRSLT